MASTPKTYTLSSGEVVTSKSGDWPTQYTNRSQAYRGASRLMIAGVNATVIQRGRPFYVKILEQSIDIKQQA